MESIVVTTSLGSTYELNSRERPSAVTRAEQINDFTGIDVVSMTVTSAAPIAFGIGDYIVVFGRKYFLNQPPEMVKKGGKLLSYQVKWEGRAYDLLRVVYLDLDDDGIALSSSFSLTGKLSLFLDVLVNNLNRVYGNNSWIVGSCPDTGIKTLSFDDENCLSALQGLCSEDNFNMRFNIIEDQGTCTINMAASFGSRHDTVYEHGKGKGLYEIERLNVSDKNLITRLYAFGASNNIPSGYRNHSSRLKLPDNDQSYIEAIDTMSAYGLIEGVKVFDDIYPHYDGTVTSLGNGVLVFHDADVDFDVNASENGSSLYLVGTPAKISFRSGGLAGYEFEATYRHTDRSWTLRPFKDERGLEFPSPDSLAFQVQVGDEYTILNIMMPDSYVTAAEEELAEVAAAYLSENCQPRVQYSLSIDDSFLKDIYSIAGAVTNVFAIGDSLHIVDADIGVDKYVTIKAFTRDMYKKYMYKVDLCDIREISLTQRLIAASAETKKIIKLNKLADVKRAQKNWQTTREALDMIFDTDGYFDGGKIKPGSIETRMLAVGAKSQQLSLDVLIEPNYNANKNVVMVNTGTLSHFGISDTVMDWLIQAGTTTLENDNAYYIYAKCSKANAGGVILFSQEQITVDQDVNYYHFLIGNLHSVDAITNTRHVSLSYGSTTVNGRWLRTGRIESSGSGGTYFDLDTGEIGGIIKFLSGDSYKNITEIESAAGDAAAAAAAAGLAVNPNLMSGGYANITSTTSQYAFWANNVGYNIEIKEGVTYTLSARGKRVSGSGSLNVYLYSSGWTWSKVIGISDTDLTIKSIVFTANSNQTVICQAFNYPNGGGGQCYIEWAMLQEGEVLINENTSFKPTPEESALNQINILPQKYLLDWNNTYAGIATRSTDTYGQCLIIRQQWLYQYIGGATSYNDIFGGEITYKTNKVYTLKMRARLQSAASYAGLLLRFNYSDGTYSSWITVDKDDITPQDYTLVSANNKTVTGISCTYGTYPPYTVLYEIGIFEGGNQVYGYPACTIDVSAAAAAAATAQSTADNASKAALATNPNLCPDGWWNRTFTTTGTFPMTGKFYLETGKTYTMSCSMTGYIAAQTNPILCLYDGTTRLEYWNLYSNTAGNVVWRTLQVSRSGMWEMRMNVTSGQPHVDWVMVQEGAVLITAATTWKETPEEAIENSAKMKGFTTIEGGLITTNIIKLGNINGTESAGISGLENSSSSSIPAFWAAGTMAEGIAKTAGVYIFRNGETRLGNFFVDLNGNAYIKDENGNRLVELGTGDVPTVADLSATALDYTLSPASQPSGQATTTTITWTSTSYNLTRNNTRCTISGQMRATVVEGDTYASIDIQLFLVKDNVDILIQSLSVSNSGVYDSTVPVGTTMDVSSGTYSFKAVITPYGVGGTYTVWGLSAHFVNTASVKRNIFGRDGLLLSYDGYNYLRAIINASNNLDFDIKTAGSVKIEAGTFNVPGVICGAVVNANGIFAKKFGNFGSNTANATYNSSTKIYTVNHSLGRNNYIPVCSTYHNENGSCFTAQVRTINVNNFTVQVCGTNSVGYQVGFSFVMYGDNK